MNERFTRRHRQVISVATLFFYWHASLFTSFAHAQSAESPEPAHEAQSSSSQSKDAPKATYDDDSLSQLSGHVAAESPGPSAAAPEANSPEQLSDVDKALAALPTGGGSVSPQAVALPSGAATQLGMGESFTAQLSTGSAGFRVPFGLLAARGGAQPSLGLSYSSSSGFDIAGAGWSLTTIGISRQSDRGSPKYDDRATWHPEQDRFTFGGNELVPICTVTGTACTGAQAGEVMPAWAAGWQYFRARIEGAFLRFFWSPDHLTWRVQGKDGVSLELGRPLDGTNYQGGLERNPESPSQVSRWYLVRQYDILGANLVQGPSPVNVVVYRYVQDGNVAYLSDIYDTTPANDPRTTDLAKYAHHTAISYEARPDVALSYRTGWYTERALRVTNVDVTSKPWSGTGPRELVRRYHLQYDSASHKSRLMAVQMEGRCTAPTPENAAERLPVTSCARLPKLRFDYQKVASGPKLLDSQGYSFDSFDTTIRKVAQSPAFSLSDRRVGLMDINADGLQDLLVTGSDGFGGDHGVFFSAPRPRGDAAFGSGVRMPVRPAADVTYAGVLSFTNPAVTGLDLDADGIVNLVHMPRAKRYSIFSPRKSSTNSALYEWVGREVATASRQDVKVDFTGDSANVTVMDVNADGLVDVVYSSATELQTFFALGRYPGGVDQFGTAVRTSATQATVSNEPSRSCMPWSSTPVRFSDPDTRLADMNGDGLVDIVRVRPGRVLYWPGRGNGFWGTKGPKACVSGFAQNQHIEMARSPQFGSTLPGRLQLGDVNGDGLADMIEFGFRSVDVYLNDGAFTWTDRHTIANTPYLPADSNHARITDINGSGTPDILWGAARDYQFVDLTGGVTPDVLTRVSNGVGKTIDFEYRAPAAFMAAAATAGTPWSEVAPISMPLLTAVTTRNNLHLIGRPSSAYRTEYSYRDAVYEGRQREFRGFRKVTVSALGDSNSPTSYQRIEFLLGECSEAYADAQAGSCSAEDASRDNWREALKGLPSSEQNFDEYGVFRASGYTTYSLRQLYKGSDGRRVVMAVPSRKVAYLYDTANFDRISTTPTLAETEILIPGLERTVMRPRVVVAQAGTARLESATVADNFGNTTDAIHYGCTAGCPNGVDEQVIAHSDYTLPAGDTSGWLWRESRSYVHGSVQTARRNEQVHVYNSNGFIEESYAVLSGTLPLDRFHAAGLAVAPSPATQSAGVSAPVQILTSDHSYDEFGHPVFSRAANSYCSSGSFDLPYALLPVVAREYGGPLDSATNCGSRVFTQQVTYDAGLQVAVSALDARNQPSRYDYDGFGRLVATTYVDPETPGHLASYPNFTAAYVLPSDDTVTPYSVTVTRGQDGLRSSVDSYREMWVYNDGFGRTIAGLTQADPSANDAGAWVVQGDVYYDAKGEIAQRYDPWFYNGSPSTYLSTYRAPTTPYSSQEFDAFGRRIRHYGYDRGIEGSVVYHALSTDIYDAGDILPNARQGTYFTTFADGHGRGVRHIERFRPTPGGQISERTTLNEHLPTGELRRVIHRLAGQPDVTRWLRYDSLGRVVLNVEPNTSQGYNPNPDTLPSSVKAWRYAYDDSGRVVGTSDARGCGANYFYDTASRLVAEDRSPCEAAQAPYSAPNLSTGDGTEIYYRYDQADPEAVVVEGQPFAVNASFLWGRLASVSSTGSKGVARYDAVGQRTGIAIKLQKPGVVSTALASRYAPRWYARAAAFDAAGRVTRLESGAKVPELLGTDGTSEVRFSYTRRGAVRQINSSYGLLHAGDTRLADGRIQELRLGDASSIRRYYTFDAKQRVRDVQTYRGSVPLWSSPGSSGYSRPVATDDPTQQLLLEDTTLVYDVAGALIRAEDHRMAEDWPASAKPVTREFVHDDFNRATQVTYQHAGGNAWVSPFAKENSDPTRIQPTPHISFTSRVTSQSFRYDWLGNTTQSTDDQQAFWDRSTGDRTHGTATAGPHRLLSASNRTLASGSPRRGDAEVGYDAAGNITGIIVRRDGPCLPTGASCWQRYSYRWDEIGQLSDARRWDLTAGTERTSHAGGLAQVLPTRAPDADLRYGYSTSGARVLKTAVDRAGAQRHTLYVFDTLEVRSTPWNGTDYVADKTTVSLNLSAGSIRARIIPKSPNMPGTTAALQHVFLQFSDHLGSTSFIVDYATGELVEDVRYFAYGAVESDYRPNRWQGYREPYKFTGKEEDIEVGLTYFGARYYSAQLGIFLSPDPVTIHELGSDFNPYTYAGGSPLMAVDPDGREPFTVFLICVAIAVVISAAVNAGTQYANTGTVEMWGAGGVMAAAGIGAVGAIVGGGVGGIVAGGLAGALGGVGAGIAGGVIGGAAAGAASYGLGVRIGTYEYTSKGAWAAIGGGALTGGIGGGVGAGVGAQFGAGWGAFAGGASSGVSGYAVNGAATGDWSGKTLALSVGIAVAGSMAAHYGSGAGKSPGKAPETPAEEVATAQKAPTADAFDDVLANLEKSLDNLPEPEAGKGPGPGGPRPPPVTKSRTLLIVEGEEFDIQSAGWVGEDGKPHGLDLMDPINAQNQGDGRVLGTVESTTTSPTAGKKVDAATRQRILARDQNPDGSWDCATCGQNTTNPDNIHTGHIVPRSKGGDLSGGNLRCEGAACNLSQGNRSAPKPGMTCAERGSCGAPYGRTD